MTQQRAAQKAGGDVAERRRNEQGSQGIKRQSKRPPHRRPRDSQQAIRQPEADESDKGEDEQQTRACSHSHVAPRAANSRTAQSRNTRTRGESCRFFGYSSDTGTEGGGN